MPTGYTYGVSEGKITEVKDYVMLCARAFGATVMMRDEPLSAPIPEFKPSNYSYDALEAAKTKLQELQSLSNDEINRRIDLEHWYHLDRNKKIREEKIQERQRYLDMLEKVKEWKAPTSDHIQLKEFCINQLNESMRFGFSDEDLDRYYPLDLPKQTVEEWLEDSIAECKKEIDYHSKEWTNEVQRTNDRNEWVEQLRNSFN